jgi:ribokinase
LRYSESPGAMAAERGRVVVVGSINADRVTQVAKLPGPGETVMGGELAHLHGGKGANQAAAAAVAGAQVVLIAAVGEDDAGAEELSVLRASGVDCAQVRCLPGAVTGMALIMVDARAENQIVVIPGANARLTAAHIGDSLTRLALHRDDVILVCNEVSAEAVGAAISGGASAGARVIYNPAPARALDVGPAAFQIITPNRSELEALTGSDQLEQAAMELSDRTGTVVVVTVGAAGAVIASPAENEVTRIEAPACNPIDTVGAGDFFNGVLAARLAAGIDLPEAVSAGVQSASESTLWRGARAPGDATPRGD